MLWNKGARLALLSLIVECSNVDKGCEWKGAIRDLTDHLATCGFSPIPCPRYCTSNGVTYNHFLRKDMERHLADCPNRYYECGRCGEKGVYATIKHIHDKTCPKMILPCPNAGCSKVMQRQQLFQHANFECEHTMIECIHKSIGCDTRLKRKDMAEHEQNDTFHLNMAINTITFLTRQMRNKESLKFRVPEYQHKKNSNTEFYSPCSYTSCNGYYGCVRVDANGYGDGKGTHVSVSACFIEGKYDAKLNCVTTCITLLNQWEDSNHHQLTMNIVSSDNMKIGTRGMGTTKFISHSELASKPYLKDDTLYFSVSVVVAGHKPWLE